MTTASATPLMTADEFDRLPGHECRVELVDGQVVRHPMAGMDHGYVGMNAGVLIAVHVKQHDLGRVCGLDTLIRTQQNPDRVRGADALFISYARLPKDQPRPKGRLDIPPELVVEVRSPSDRIGDLTVKADEYLRAGVAVVVVLDPDSTSAAVFRENELPFRLHNGDELTLPDILPGFSVRVREFFE